MSRRCDAFFEFEIIDFGTFRKEIVWSNILGVRPPPSRSKVWNCFEQRTIYYGDWEFLAHENERKTLSFVARNPRFCISCGLPGSQTLIKTRKSDECCFMWQTTAPWPWKIISPNIRSTSTWYCSSYDESTTCKEKIIYFVIEWQPILSLLCRTVTNT